MNRIKNEDGKTVCFVDKKTRAVEIIKNGYRTVITFLPDSSYKIVNIKVN